VKKNLRKKSSARDFRFKSLFTPFGRQGGLSQSNGSYSFLLSGWVFFFAPTSVRKKKKKQEKKVEELETRARRGSTAKDDQWSQD
jgi:hypothetical protein